MVLLVGGHRASVWIIFEGSWSCISSGVGMFLEEGVSNAGLRYDVLDVGDPPARF